MLPFFQRIFQKWLGGKVDFDKQFGFQCVDWVKQYCKEAGFPITTYGNAIDLWKSGLGPNFRRVMNTPSVFPEAGDVVIFRGPTQYGHIAIADMFCTAKVLNVVEQNAGNGNGNGKGANAIRKHTYNYITPRVLGWFTPIR